MRFEFPTSGNVDGVKFTGALCGAKTNPTTGADEDGKPCVIMVDVNGDKRPNPNASGSQYTFPAPNSTRINDIFLIMITDTAAIPYGVVSQRTMFQND